jgi:hypothetical protein
VTCERGSTKAAKAAGQNGVSPTASRSGYTAASTAQVSFFAPVGRQGGSRKRRKRTNKAGKPNGRGQQLSFFEQNRTVDSPKRSPVAPTKALPSQRQIYVTQAFTPEELDKVVVKLHLGAAATKRHVSELNGGRSRGIGHSDPRPLDWARSDQQQYDFLIDQLRRARRGHGYLDTRPLKKAELVELWEFARFEADRAHRNIDHLTSGLSHLKGPTADYLAQGHRLEARFFSFLAEQIETLIPKESLVRESW